jgi:hypothetical protein
VTGDLASATTNDVNESTDATCRAARAGGAQAARARLASFFGPSAIEAIESYVDERIAAQLAQTPAVTNGAPEWLSLQQAADRLDCSPDAVRMRARRGRLEARHQGRRLYVSRRSVDGAA